MLSSSSDNEQEYGVEKILGKKQISGHPFYLIKWEGYPISQSTWEPVENLAHSQEILGEFEREYQRKKKTPPQFTPQQTVPIKSMFQALDPKLIAPTRILGIKYTPQGYMYQVLWEGEYGQFTETYMSHEIAEQWPRLLIDYLESFVTLYADPYANSNNNYGHA